MSKIEWTDVVLNPVTGCTRASAGCDNCYAVKMTKRLQEIGDKKYIGLVNDGKSHFNGVVKCHEDVLTKPLSWKKPKRVFVNSMSDLFHKDVPFEFIDKVFAVMALCPQHTFQILTKRPERMAEYFSRYDHAYFSSMVFANALRHIRPEQAECYRNASSAVQFPLPNVWLGTSCENQEAADERIPHLLKCPAAVRFLSIEPQIGPVDFRQWIGYNPLHETNTPRRSGLRSGQDGPAGGSGGRVGVADEVPPPQPMECGGDDHRSRATPPDRLEGGVRLQAGQGDDGPKAGGLSGSSSDMASLSRSHSGKHADQPHQREQGGQSSVQSRIDGREREPEARASSRTGEPEGNQEQPQPVQSDGHRGHQDRLFTGPGDSGRDSASVWSGSPDNLKDCQGGQDGERERDDSRLHGEPSPRDASSQSEGAVSLVIVGGESGAGARPFDPQWALSLKAQCESANVPFFFKQMGSNPIGVQKLNSKGSDWVGFDELRIREFPR